MTTTTKWVDWLTQSVINRSKSREFYLSRAPRINTKLRIEFWVSLISVDQCCHNTAVESDLVSCENTTCSPVDNTCTRLEFLVITRMSTKSALLVSGSGAYTPFGHWRIPLYKVVRCPFNWRATFCVVRRHNRVTDVFCLCAVYIILHKKLLIYNCLNFPNFFTVSFKI